MQDLESKVSRLLPLLTQWAETLQTHMAERARPLTLNESTLAFQAGVLHPSRIRLCEVRRFPIPESTVLRDYVDRFGLLGQGAHGLTLGYLVLLREGQASTPLLRHEFVHVSQYERFGSLSAFFTEYLTQLLTHGNDDPAWGKKPD